MAQSAAPEARETIIASQGALPTAVVIGAMKCGTTALHRYLAAHPQVSAAAAKEVNFFVGGEDPAVGRWHRGAGWYASLFDAAMPVRVESSPGYTSPDHPDVPARMAQLLPDVRLLYLVRHPVRRAMSQYRHHRRDGVETRPVEEALLDPGSHYVARSRYHERLQPFLHHFPREQLLVVVQERLRVAPLRQLRRVYDHIGAEPDFAAAAPSVNRSLPAAQADPPEGVGEAVAELVADDVAALRRLMDDQLREWEL